MINFKEKKSICQKKNKFKSANIQYWNVAEHKVLSTKNPRMD